MALSSTVAAESRPSVLAVLRARTRALHDEVESGVDMKRALASREGYRTLLEGYLGLYRPFEAALAGGTAEAREVAGYPTSARVPLLERDLQALGASAGEIAGLPDAAGLPDLSHEDAMLGALYVIEGSQLGGQMIFREAEKALHVTAEQGAAFFYGEGDGTGRHWKRFVASLEEQVKDAEVAADAAAAMFRYFEQGLAGKSGQREKE